MFQKTELNLFRKDFGEAVKELEKKYGVKLELHSISYSDIEFHTKLTATKVGESGEKQVDTSAFSWMKELLGFKGNLGDSYTNHKGVTYTVYNLDPKKPKYAVLLKGSDGKTYKASVPMVNMHLLAQKSRE
jgi:hypothetical protein